MPVADRGRARRPVSAEPPPPFPGASKHSVHQPHACSTPRKNIVDPKPQHIRSATEPAAAVGELRLSEAINKGGSPEKHQGLEIEPLQQSVGVGERLRKRELLAKRVKRNTERTRHKRSHSADAKKNHDPNYYHRSAFTNDLISEKNAPSNLHDHELHMPGYCPSMPPHFCPYHHHYHHHHPCYTFGSQYPTLSLPPPPPLVCPQCALAQQQQELEKQRAREERGNHSSNGSSQRCSSAPGVRIGAKDTEQPLSGVATGGVLGDGSPSPSSSLASGVKSIQLLAEEMLSTLQHSIDTAKMATGTSKCTGKFNG